MLPGPTYIYECENCGNKISQGSLMSGNTFGAITYSDGFTLAPMLPQFPILVKCKICKNYLWLNRIKPADEIEPFADVSKQEDIQIAEFLELDDYEEVLDKGFYEEGFDEFYVRQQILWKLNDLRRGKKKLLPILKHKKLWEKNIHRLLEIIDLDNFDQKILAAELYRYKGDFEKCLDLINDIENADYEYIIKAFRKKCEQKDKEVFELRNEF